VKLLSYEKDLINISESESDEDEDSCSLDKIISSQVENTIRGNVDGNDLLQLQQQREDISWLRRVVEKLEPLSKLPENYNQLALGDKFLNLKEQWGYTGKYKQVDPNNHDCKLCDHKHIAANFKIINMYDEQKKTSTGSRCIMQFKVTKNGQFQDENTSRNTIKLDIIRAAEERKNYQKRMERFLKRR
jgi:hypothetical protein